ncbi:glycosyltransferase family 2 protein [Arthrobacter sp. YAF34]|uniref:glycosyltransferase family 2 protein n=1 Tax=Arthrobacter sp. YAF34 TaxID=3233083 RepID=UPI003F934CF1
MTTVDAGRLNRRVRTLPAPVPGSPATVTVVISCFNYERYLRQAVESALTQAGVTVDVIIVDDASTDASLQLARELSASHPNVAVINHRANVGVVETFNDGAKAATGEFLVRLDADDLLTPGALARATQVAAAYPSVGLIYGRPVHFETEEPPAFRGSPSAWTVWPGHKWLADRCRSGTNVITAPEVVMRRSVLGRVGYQAPLRHTHDMELWLRISAFSDVAYIHGVDQAWHREHPASMSAREVDPLVDLKERREAFDVLFAGPAGEVAGAHGLRQAATRALVDEALNTAAHEIDRGHGASPLYEFCLRLARDMDPGVTQGPAWRRVTHPAALAAAAKPWGRGRAVLRRGVGRVRSEFRWRNWRRNGVF